MKEILVIIFLINVSISCHSDKLFNKETWNDRNDIFYDNREAMVNDLMANYIHPGMSYNEIIGLLGKPEDYSDLDPNTMAYEISVDYGKDIDPIKGKNLIITFSKDSFILNFNVEEWKRQ